MDDSDIFEAVRRNLGVVVYDLDTSTVTLDNSLAELGCNSIDRAEVVTLTMEDMGISVPVMEFQQTRDIRSLVTLLARHSA
ncbi:phosphopantetheine-binding protein [Streptomyces sp. NPDC088337]|uniref:phosphopantetheine-binding protein n=1 Tax=unclassified Streptomyces TaxID=2593676 RepID=UPI002DD97BF5|nr:phosphopantetheine-binding protein [Streptomyces sp. NBC_01788]WSB30247.1 phosphopantetheine-binding protein [Streptomyces sp. NBC_01788]